MLHWLEAFTTVAERDSLTIDGLWERFEVKYFPQVMQSEMQRKFMDLKQGSRTVAEYEEEFIVLSYFAKEDMSIEQWKIEKFVSGMA